MFERYTERARRVLFFARYEASQLGSISIETEHLLLGLIREGKGLTSRIFARSHLSLESIRKEIELLTHKGRLSFCCRLQKLVGAYWRQTVFPAALGLSLLHMTVLGFDGVSMKGESK